MMPDQVESNQPLPKTIQGYVSVDSIGKVSVFGRMPSVPSETKGFHAARKDLRTARKALESMGFEIIAQSRMGIAVAGPTEAYEELSGGELVTRERWLYAEGGRQRYVTHIDIVGPKQPDSFCVGVAKSKASKIEGFLVERPLILHGISPSPLPALTDRFHLRVPDDIAAVLGATGAHRMGYRGDDVLVAIVDTGHYPHPFFGAHRYDIKPTITAVLGTNPETDPVGHGTGESANVFAIAPNAALQPYRAVDDYGHLVGAMAGFLKAKQGSPQIITNSWGGDGRYPTDQWPTGYRIAWALEIIDAVEQGIVVVFSSGNGSFGIEPQIPGVLAAGGVFMAPDLKFQASDITSGFESPWFRGVTVPGACGLVGMSPRAQYIMLPVQPGSHLDIVQSRPHLPLDPDDDGTAADDGWALFSGSSAAAPQLAGIAALILSARPDASPWEVKTAIESTATDITAGKCHPRFGFPAKAGHDLACGHGLANAEAALKSALSNGSASRRASP